MSDEQMVWGEDGTPEPAPDYPNAAEDLYGLPEDTPMVWGEDGTPEPAPEEY